MADAAVSRQRELFAQELDELRRRRTRIGCILSLTLVPAGAALDLSTYPDRFLELLAGRVVCVAVVLVVFVLLFFEASRRYSRALSIVWGLAPALAISWMIYVTDGSVSPFYAGLNLVILGTCVLLPFSALEATLYCAVVYASYAAAALLHGATPFNSAAFTTYSIFVWMTSAICITASHFVSASRWNEFQLRYALSEHNERLTELDRMKSQFFANVSHELRTPLTLVMAPVERLLHEGTKLLPEVRDALQLVHRNAQRLLNLIDDLLELIRFENSNVEMERRAIDLGSLLGALVESVSALASSKEIEVAFDRGEAKQFWVRGDLRQLERLFLNLLTNAAKFTGSGGRIRVEIGEDGSDVVATVTDTGPGIRSADLPHIFERFRKGDDPNTRGEQGLGIGLALVREIANAHGGEVTVRSEYGKGASFLVRIPGTAAPETKGEAKRDRQPPSIACQVLPVAEGMAPAAATGRAVVAGSTERANVVVVDDEPDMWRFLSDVLQRRFEVAAFESAADALAWLANVGTFPEVIVTDQMMPGIDGLEFCHRIRELQGTTYVKLLMVTARVDDAVKLEALRSGVDDFLTKPFSAVELETRVTNLAEAARLERGLAEKNEKLAKALKDLHDAEVQLVQSAKMSSLGTLTAGLLHEINNPLNHTLMAIHYCQGTVSQQANGIPGGESIKEISDALNDIDSGVKRVARIVTDLRQFAYPESQAAEQVFPIANAVRTALRFTAHELAGIRVEDEVNDRHLVEGIETQLVQVMVNLLVNSAQAVKSVHANGEGLIRVVSKPVAGRIEVSVWDNGVGIAPENLGRLFDPFFTTKEVGSGMGLGLSISHTIVKRHGGQLVVRSEQGAWSEFSFDIPIAGENGAQDVRHAHADAGTLGG